MSISPASLDGLRALALGFAFAGLLATGYELLMARRLSFRLLREGDLAAVASVPILVFSAPFIIIRNLVRARPGRWPFSVVFVATIIAGAWSLLCGHLVLGTAFRLVGA